MDKRVLLLPLTLILLACATTQRDGPRRSSSVLLADEIAEAAVITAAEAIERCRPQWLTIRTPTTSAPMGTPPRVYVDGLRQAFSELDRIRADMVSEVRYLRSSDATNRFGTNHASGAILVTTR